MRRLLLAMTIVGMTWTVPQNAEAGLFSYIGRATVKLVHGVGDIIYSPLELIISPVTHGIDFDRHDVPATIGAGIGLQVGATKTYIRATRGVVDIATFLLVSERPRHWEWTLGGHQLPLSVTLWDDDSGYSGEDAVPNR